MGPFLHHLTLDGREVSVPQRGDALGRVGAPKCSQRICRPAGLTSANKMTERLEQVQRAFSAYTIERELGSGGMANGSREASTVPDLGARSHTLSKHRRERAPSGDAMRARCESVDDTDRAALPAIAGTRCAWRRHF